MVSETFCRNLDNLIMIDMTLEQNHILRPLKRSLKSIPEFYVRDPVEPSCVCVKSENQVGAQSWPHNRINWGSL